MPSQLLDPLILVSTHRLDPRSLARDVERGLRIRVKRGAYYDASAWQALDARQQQRVRIEAFAASHRGVVFSHWSAAMLSGIPFIGPVPDRVHVIAGRASGGRSEPGLARHTVGVSDIEVAEANGLRFTTPIRTAVDLATVQPFRFAVAPVDHLLQRVSREQLFEALLLANPGHGFARAGRALAFGDADAANPGESLSRATIHELGFPAPELQVGHLTRRGGTYYCDFEWRMLRLAGEFDGEGKYLKAEFLGKLSPGEAVLKEKRREDELRAEGLRFARWGWAEAMSGHRLRDILVQAGLARA